MKTLFLLFALCEPCLEMQFGRVGAVADSGNYSIKSEWEESALEGVEYWVRHVKVKCEGESPIKVTRVRLAEFSVNDGSKVKTLTEGEALPMVALNGKTIAFVEHPQAKVEVDGDVVIFYVEGDFTLAPEGRTLEFNVVKAKFK